MITSFSNPLIKQIKRLRLRKYREREGLFFMEGLRLVFTAVEQQAPLERIVYAPDLLTSERAYSVIAELAGSGVKCTPVAAPVFQSISERENPAGLGAIAAIRQSSLSGWRANEKDIFVALENVSDPGNLGTILRTMDAVGAAGLILAGRAVDAWHSAAVKASMGALFTTPISRVDDLAEALEWAAREGAQTIATSARAPIPYRPAAYRLPALLLMGSEGEGLSAATIAGADLAVTIPMVGSASSLNLAVAAGLLLYELFAAK